MLLFLFKRHAIRTEGNFKLYQRHCEPIEKQIAFYSNHLSKVDNNKIIPFQVFSKYSSYFFGFELVKTAWILNKKVGIYALLWLPCKR